MYCNQLQVPASAPKMAKHRKNRNHQNGQSHTAPYTNGNNVTNPTNISQVATATPKTSNWTPPPYDSTNPPAPIVHPIGANAPNFDNQELCDDVGLAVAIALRSLLARENNPNQPPPPPKDGDLDPQTCLEELELKILTSPQGLPFFSGMSNAHALIVVNCSQKKRNSTQHNDLPLLNSNLHVYLSAAYILVGPGMVNSPQALAKVNAALQKVLLIPIPFSSLPIRPT